MIFKIQHSFCTAKSGKSTLSSIFAQCTRYRFSSLAIATTKIQEILEINDKTLASNEANAIMNHNPNDSKLGIYKQLKATRSIEEIHKLLNEYEPTLIKLRQTQFCDLLKYPTMHKLYPAAIKQCAFLNLENEGWKLFNLCKERQILSSYIYSVMMWFAMHFEPNSKGLTKTFDLFHEMQRETTLIPTAMIDAVLIYNCCKVGEYEKGYDVLNKIKNNKNSNVLFSSQTLCTSIANLYVQSKNIENGLVFMFNLYKTYKVVPNSRQTHLLLRGIADKMAPDMDVEEKQRYLHYARKLFDFSFSKNKGISPPILVYGAYINVFAKMGDYETCIDFIECMAKNEDYPMPNEVCFSTAMSALIHLNRVYDADVVHQNKVIEQIMSIMKRVKVDEDDDLYRILMQIAKQHGDVDRVQGFYKKLKRKRYREVKLMVNYSLECYQRMQCDEADIAEFKRWALEEYKCYSTLPLTEQESANEAFAQMIDDNL